MSFATKKSMIRCFEQLDIIEYSRRILLQILCEKSCSHILIVHLIKVDDDIVIGKMTLFIHFKFSSIWHLDCWQNGMDIIANHALFHFTFHYNGKPKMEWGNLSGMWKWNKSHCPQVECFQWNVSQILINLLILNNWNKNHKLIRCNQYKMECAKCHKFFEQVSLVDLMPPFFP
jgi:hypothetical protein